MKQKINRLSIFFNVFSLLIVLTFSVAMLGQKKESNGFKTKNTTTFTEQEISPIVDGFVAQSSGTFNSTSTTADLKRGTGFNREIYMTYDFSGVTIAAKSGKLNIFCQSFDKFGDITISVYCLPEAPTTGLAYATRPKLPTAINSLIINETEHAGTWL